MSFFGHFYLLDVYFVSKKPPFLTKSHFFGLVKRVETPYLKIYKSKRLHIAAHNTSDVTWQAQKVWEQYDGNFWLYPMDVYFS